MSGPAPKVRQEAERTAKGRGEGEAGGCQGGRGGTAYGEAAPEECGVLRAGESEAQRRAGTDREEETAAAERHGAGGARVERQTGAST